MQHPSGIGYSKHGISTGEESLWVPPSVREWVEVLRFLEPEHQGMPLPT